MGDGFKYQVAIKAKKTNENITEFHHEIVVVEINSCSWIIALLCAPNMALYFWVIIYECLLEVIDGK